MKLSLLAIGLLLLSIVAIAEPPNVEYYAINPHTNPSPPSAQTAVDDVITILLDQGFAGAIIRQIRIIESPKKKTSISSLKLVLSVLLTWQVYQQD